MFMQENRFNLSAVIRIAVRGIALAVIFSGHGEWLSFTVYFFLNLIWTTSLAVLFSVYERALRTSTRKSRFLAWGWAALMSTILAAAWLVGNIYLGRHNEFSWLVRDVGLIAILALIQPGNWLDPARFRRKK